MQGVVRLPILALAIAAIDSPTALAQAPGEPEAEPVEAATTPGYVFLEPTVGVAVPLADGTYDEFIDTSFAPTIAGGYFFALGGSETSIAPEGSITYMPLTVDRLDFVNALDDHDVYAGRFRVTAGVRFQVGLQNLYLFARAGVGFELVHAAWTGTEADGRHIEDSELSAGLVLLSGLGFGARVLDVLGITVRLDVPTALHWDADDGAVNYRYHSTELELSAGVTIFI